MKSFVEATNELDVEFKMELEELEKEIDQMNKKTRDSIYQEEGTDAREWYATYLTPYMGQCIKITTTAGASVFDGSWEDKFKEHIEAIVAEITSGLYSLDGHWTHGLLDSVLV